VIHRSVPLSRATEADIRFTAQKALDVIEQGVPGVFVECGVWRGGCSAAMLLAQQAQHGDVLRKVYLLDSFEGLPAPKERDGPFARAWYDQGDKADVAVEEVSASIASFGLAPEKWELVPGWFDSTVPVLAERLLGEQIALLRLDGDWYDSTAVCLEHLVAIVPDGGVVILDDYYVFDGCARATHDFLSRHDAPYRICPVPQGLGAFFVKGPGRPAPAPA
jgi:hypothetical protein